MALDLFIWFHISDSLLTHRINVQKPKFQFWEATQIYVPAHPLPLCNCSPSHSDEPQMPTLTCMELAPGCRLSQERECRELGPSPASCAWGISRPRAQPCWVRPPVSRAEASLPSHPIALSPGHTATSPRNHQAEQTLTCKLFFLRFDLTCGFCRMTLFLNMVTVTEDDEELRSPLLVGGNSFCWLKKKRTRKASFGGSLRLVDCENAIKGEQAAYLTDELIVMTARKCGSGSWQEPLFFFFLWEGVQRQLPLAPTTWQECAGIGHGEKVWGCGVWTQHNGFLSMKWRTSFPFYFI